LHQLWIGKKFNKGCIVGDPSGIVAVLFLIFNRPEAVRSSLAAIRTYRPSRLYIAADGPRSTVPGEKNLAHATRKEAEQVDWPCRVERLYRDSNLGCRQAVSGALDWFFRQEESGIVIEDDVVSAPDFFPFCERLLDRYRDEPRIRMVAGMNYAPNQKLKTSYFFSRYFPVWGWASWRRAWLEYDGDLTAWRKSGARKELAGLCPIKSMASYYTSMFDAFVRQGIDTWDIQWAYSCLRAGGLAAVPRVNLTTNIGVEGTRGTGIPSSFQLLPTGRLDGNTLRHPPRIAVDRRQDRAVMTAILRGSGRNSYLGLILDRACRVLR
jgi:hypothetical protein